MTLLAVGDSVVWGQGLAHEDKFASIVFSRLIGGDLPEGNIEARSGAIIGGRKSAGPPISATTVPDRTARHEIPHSSPSVMQQVAGVSGEEATVELLLLDGGINDMNIRNALDPTTGHDDGTYDPPTGEDDHDASLDIEDLVRGYCYEDMKALIEAARETFPNAVIVVTGYFPILSEETATAALVGASTVVFGALAGIGGAAVAKAVVNNAKYLHSRQLYWLRRAVAEADADPTIRGPGVLFAHPGFAAENSLFAADPWLFEPGEPDAQRDVRMPACDTLDRGVICENAAVGHPNGAGARAYADAIENRVRAHSRRSLREEVVPLAEGGAPVSIRDTIEGYGFDPEMGLRVVLNHTIVDVIEVTVWTGDNGTDSDVFLALNGKDRWQLDTEWRNDFEAATTHTFTLDPMLIGRSQPLGLDDIDTVRIEKEGLFSWALDRIRIRINGRTVLDGTPGVELSGDDEWTGNYPT